MRRCIFNFIPFFSNLILTTLVLLAIRDCLFFFLPFSFLWKSMLFYFFYQFLYSDFLPFLSFLPNSILSNLFSIFSYLLIIKKKKRNPKNIKTYMTRNPSTHFILLLATTESHFSTIPLFRNRTAPPTEEH